MLYCLYIATLAYKLQNTYTTTSDIQVLELDLDVFVTAKLGNLSFSIDGDRENLVDP